MSDETITAVNERPGWIREMGLTLLRASADEVTCEWEVSEKHHQQDGIVHGCVHCGVVETLCSIGAAEAARPRGQRVVVLENCTSFLRAIRSGKLLGCARPITRGRTTQVWEAWIRDPQGNLVAQGRVRLLCLDAERSLG
jgi:uncharacterized protein (TIGR00369 family)